MGKDFRMGAESCRWISMQTVTLLYPRCAISQTMKRQRSIRNELQNTAKQDLISISKKMSSYNLVMFLWQRNSNTTRFGFFWPLNNRFGLFLVFLALFGFLVKFSSDNPASSVIRDKMYQYRLITASLKGPGKPACWLLRFGCGQYMQLALQVLFNFFTVHLASETKVWLRCFVHMYDSTCCLCSTRCSSRMIYTKREGRLCRQKNGRALVETKHSDKQEHTAQGKFLPCCTRFVCWSCIGPDLQQYLDRQF